MRSLTGSDHRLGKYFPKCFAGRPSKNGMVIRNRNSHLEWFPSTPFVHNPSELCLHSRKYKLQLTDLLDVGLRPTTLVSRNLTARFLDL